MNINWHLYSDAHDAAKLNAEKMLQRHFDQQLRMRSSDRLSNRKAVLNNMVNWLKNISPEEQYHEFIQDYILNRADGRINRTALIESIPRFEQLLDSLRKREFENLAAAHLQQHWRRRQAHKKTRAAQVIQQAVLKRLYAQPGSFVKRRRLADWSS